MFLVLSFFHRDISFLYDATGPDKTSLDSAGKSLVTPASDKSKTSPKNKQLDFVGKSKGESGQEDVVSIKTCQNININKTVCQINRASDISRKKKQNFAAFSGANSRKNRPISLDFRGEKSQNSLKNQPILHDFCWRKVKILRKIGRFHRKFLGKLRQETICKKQPISLDVLGKFH